MMHLDTALRWICMGLAATGLSACVGSKATVTSNTAPDYHPEIKRLLLLTDLGWAPVNRPDGDQEGDFEAAVTDSLGKCGITVQFNRHNALALHNEEQQAIRSFAPDTILTLTKKVSGGQREIYTGTIVDMSKKRMVWKAEVDIKLAWWAGKSMAASIVDRLKQDGILAASCPTPSVPPSI